MSTPPARGLPPKPPDKGSFLLDHFRECSDAKEKYLECLRGSSMRADEDACRKLSSEYLKCRMDKELMLKEDLSRLGYQGGGGGSSKRAEMASSEAQTQRRRGFVAGMPAKPPDSAA